MFRLTILTFFARCPHPPIDADFVATVVTAVVSELVVARPAELVAGGVVVVVVADDPHPVGDARHRPVVGERVPLQPWHQDAAVRRRVDQRAGACKDKRKQMCQLLVVQRFIEYTRSIYDRN